MFAELSITSNFTFLTGASHPEEYMERAATLGLSAIAITDTNSVAGIVRAWSEAKTLTRLIRERTELEARNGPIGPPVPGHLDHQRSPILTHVPRLIPGARIVTDTGFTATALATTRQAEMPGSRSCRSRLGAGAPAPAHRSAWYSSMR